MVSYKGFSHSFSIKNIFYDKMNLRLFYFHVTKGVLRPFSIKNVFYDKTDLGLLFSCDEVWAEMEQ